MRELLSDVESFCRAVFSHWEAVASGAVAAFLIFLLQKLLRRKIPYEVSAGVFLLVATFMAWREQHTKSILLQSQVENAQATAEIETRIDSSKLLTITNYGPPIKDLKLFVTEYTLTIEFSDRGSSVKYDTFESVNKPTGSQWQHSSLRRDESITIDLKQLPFVSFNDFHDRTSFREGIKRCYAIRITTRHAVTNKKLVHYDITSGVTGGASLFSDPEERGFGGKYLPNYDPLKLRSTIFTDQKRMFFESE